MTRKKDREAFDVELDQAANCCWQCVDTDYCDPCGLPSQDCTCDDWPPDEPDELTNPVEYYAALARRNAEIWQQHGPDDPPHLLSDPPGPVGGLQPMPGPVGPIPLDGCSCVPVGAAHRPPCIWAAQQAPALDHELDGQADELDPHAELTGEWPSVAALNAELDFHAVLTSTRWAFDRIREALRWL